MAVKPEQKTLTYFDFRECTEWIEQSHEIKTRDRLRSLDQFAEWCKSIGQSVIDSRQDIKGAQQQYAAYRAAIAAGTVIERPYQDWWHWLIEVANVRRGGFTTLDPEMAEGAEPWQAEILGLYLKEFGVGPYLTDW